jgi:hypothetical protein
MKISFMKSVSLFAILALATCAQADVAGSWRGTAVLGASTIAQQMEGDQLLKLQASKNFLKTLAYEMEILPGNNFLSIATGASMPRKTGKGSYALEGNKITFKVAEENGVKVNRELVGELNPEQTKFTITIPSKPGLPVTKIIFVKISTGGPAGPAPSSMSPGTKKG